MGRPRKSDQTIVVSANGAGIVWNETVGFVGDRTLVVRATSAATYGFTVRVHPMLPEITASTETLEGVYAAISWAAGGRGFLVSGPKEVMDLFADSDGDEDDVCPDGQIEETPNLDEE